MINYFFSSLDYGSVAFVRILFAFAMTCLMLSKCTRILPKDMGRAYAHDGSLSAGKPRGAGFWFVLVYVASTLIFAKMNVPCHTHFFIFFFFVWVLYLFLVSHPLVSAAPWVFPILFGLHTPSCRCALGISCTFRLFIPSQY